MAIFFNHGQCCCAGSRLYVEAKEFDKVVDGISQIASKIKRRPRHGATQPKWGRSFPKSR